MTQSNNESGSSDNNGSAETPSTSDSVTPLHGDTNETTAKIDLNSELAKARAELEQAKNDFLYLKADFDNYKRNAIKERSDLLKYGSERALVEILNVVDNFERALSMDINENNLESFRKGIHMIYGELSAALNRCGIKEVPSEGVPFDPNVHEALSSEATDQIQPGHVSRVFRKAYRLHDKLIRTGQVVVAKESSSDKN